MHMNLPMYSLLKDIRKEIRNHKIRETCFISLILLQIIIPTSATDLSVLHYLYTCSGANPAVLFRGLQNSFPGVKGQNVM
jgi:hypothetical protein